MTRRHLALAAAAAVLVVVLATLVWLWRATSGPEPVGGAGMVPIGGPFALVDQDGRRVTEADFRGRWMLVYFGYTWCPDACPLSLTTMVEALDLLAPEVAERITPVLITVDPERDTPEVLKDYVAAFDPRLVGLTGTAEEIAAATRAWRVFARKAEPQANGDYLVDHSTFTFLMAPDGSYAAHFTHAIAPEELARRLAELVRG
jgi:cytochrome oxidase Cu insertion factor (SCO1/SenC/PrrC family)